MVDNFQAYDINDLSNIQLLSTRSSVGYELCTVQVDGDVGYVGTENTLNTYNISN